MTAAGAEPAGLKRIPRRAAAVEEVLRVITVAAIPAARCVRTPFTERATNPVELLSFVTRRGFFGSLGWLQSLLEKPVRSSKMQKLQHIFLLREHFFGCQQVSAPDNLAKSIGGLQEGS